MMMPLGGEAPSPFYSVGVGGSLGEIIHKREYGVSMQYLINSKKKKGRAHLWKDKDTYCSMYSTGGMLQHKYALYDKTHERDICIMCQNVYRGKKNEL